MDKNSKDMEKCISCMYYAPKLERTSAGNCLNGKSIAFSNTEQNICQCYEKRRDAL